MKIAKILMSLYLLTCLQVVESIEHTTQRSQGISLSQEQNSSQTETRNLRVNDFLLLTLPKSGSHLVIKLLAMLTGKHQTRDRPGSHDNGYEKFENSMLRITRQNEFTFAHLSEVEVSQYVSFLQKHPDFCKFVVIRDLRDVFLSLVNHYEVGYMGTWEQKGFRSKASFEDKLTYVLNDSFDVIGSRLKIHFENAVLLSSDPNFIVIRFEDLVGPKGGGDSELQKNTIVNIANALNVELSEEKMQYFTHNLFGISSGPRVSGEDFFKGQIGSWRSCFNAEHKRLFNQNWGGYQQALGYPLAD